MDRRKFLRSSALMSIPLFIKGIPVFADNNLDDPFLETLAMSTSSCGKVLVIIQMNGGNDGLNTVIPLDKYAELSTARSSVLIPSNQVLPLTGSTTTGLHPAMTGLRNLFDNGKVTIVQGVSYPNPNYSHFHAQDIWFSASGGTQNLNTGWLGRDLEYTFPNYPVNYPTAAEPDPPAIQIGGVTSLSLQGTNVNMGYNASSPANLLNVVNNSSGAVPNSDYGTELAFLRLMKDQSNAYASRITSAYNAQATQSTMYPASGNSLADQLKIVARLIGGGLQTPVYIVNHPDSFDTHVDQVVAGNTATGYHANALSKLSVAIEAFQNDITLMGKQDKVTGMTYSEFGRRVISNASTGTDHGSAAPVIFFGSGINGGIIGTSPTLPATINANTQVPIQYDFRQLYASVMDDWLCLTPTETSNVLFGTYNKVAVFANPSNPLPTSGIVLDGIRENGKTKLGFKVYENVTFEQFIVQGSTDAITFFEKTRKAQTSNNNEESYQVAFEISGSVEFFRIKGLLKNGGVVYSNVYRIQNDKGKQAFSVYPNPVKYRTINVKFFAKTTTGIDVSIYNDQGAQLYVNRFASTDLLTFQVDESFEAHHLYFMKVSFDGAIYTEKLSFE